MSESPETQSKNDASSDRLFRRDFLLLWQGQFVSRLGSQASSIAMMYWIMEATGSATLMGTIMMSAMLPMVLLSPIGGAIADRISRKRIIVVGDLVSGAVTLAVAAVLFLDPADTRSVIAALIVMAAVAGAVQAVFVPAVSASIPALVPRSRLEIANAMTEGSGQIATLVGQAAGGVLFRILGAPLLFLIDGLSFLFSAISEAFIRIPQDLPARPAGWRETISSVRTELHEGALYVWNNPGMRSLILAAAVMNFFGAPFIVLLPFHVEGALGSGPEWFGFMLAAIGAGGLLGYGLAAASRFAGRTRMLAMTACLFSVSVAIGAFGVTGERVPALVVMLLVGACGGAFDIWVTTLLQSSTPDALRGRVFGLLHTLVLGLTPVSMAVAGVVTDASGHNTPLMFVLCGGVLMLTTLVAAAHRPFRQYLAS